MTEDPPDPAAALWAELDEAVARDDTAAVVDRAERLLDLLPPDHPERTYPLFHAGMARLIRYDSPGGGAAADRRKATSHLRTLLALLPPGHPVAPDVSLCLGLLLSHRILLRPAKPSRRLPEAIAALTAGRVSGLLQDTALHALTGYRLGMLLALKYLTAGGTDEERKAAVAELGAILASPDTDAATGDFCRVMISQLELFATTRAELRQGTDRLTVELVGRMQWQGPLITPETIESALRQLEGVSEETAQIPFVAGTLSVLKALALLEKGMKGQELSPEDLDQVAALFDEALAGEEPGSPDAETLDALKAMALLYRARLSGENGLADQATDRLAEVLDKLSGHPAFPLLQSVYGNMVATSKSLPRSAEELTRAAEGLEQALSRMPEDHPERTAVTTRVAGMLMRAGALNQSPEQIERARDLLPDTLDGGSPLGEGLRTLMSSWADGIQGTLETNADRLTRALDQTRRASALLPPEHELHKVLGGAVAGLLGMRSMTTGSLEDIDAVRYHLRNSPAPSEERLRWITPYLNVAAELKRHEHRMTPEMLDRMIGELEEVDRAAPEEIRRLIGGARLTNVLRMFRSAAREDGFDFPASGKALADFRAAAEAVLSAGPGLMNWDAEDGMALVGAGFAGRDLRMLDRGIAMLATRCANESAAPAERLRVLGCLGQAFRNRHLLSRAGRDLDNAISRFEEARLLTRRESGMSDAASIFISLGESYFMRGDENRHDPSRAVSAGLDGLRLRMQEVLLQTGAQRPLDAALAAAGEAAQVMRWCVAAKEHESAVHALELGRAMVLHSATVDADVATLLRENGHDDLATEWEAEKQDSPWDSLEGGTLPGELSAAQVPSDLRRRVLAAVEGTEAEKRLLSPPSVAEIAGELRNANANAIVYLVPRDEYGDGLAIVVRPDGTVRDLPLPGLRAGRNGVIDSFEAAQQAFQAAPPSGGATPGLGASPQTAPPSGDATPRPRSGASPQTPTEDKPVQRRWEDAVTELGEWAWTTAMGPLFADTLAEPHARPARLVLLPVGKLGAVPWHAAHREVTGGRRYACQDTIICYAASARQFVDARRRKRRPWQSAPALVEVADNLLWVSEEMDELNEHYYPEAVHLGSSGRVRPEDVKAQLPGPNGASASVLHLSCHAYREDPPIDTWLKLSGDRPLRVRDILRHTRNRPPDAPGGLVVLATCVSDLTHSSHDEALTLATSFLAAGAVGVLGARWPVRDVPTALFMIMFHHYLNSGYEDPATALRATQLWMLNPKRRLPPGVGGLLADELSTVPLDAIASWAAFTYQGR